MAYEVVQFYESGDSVCWATEEWPYPKERFMRIGGQLVCVAGTKITYVYEYPTLPEAQRAAARRSSAIKEQHTALVLHAIREDQRNMRMALWVAVLSLLVCVWLLVSILI